MVVFYDFNQFSEADLQPNGESEMDTFSKLLTAFCKKLHDWCSSKFLAFVIEYYPCFVGATVDID